MDKNKRCNFPGCKIGVLRKGLCERHLVGFFNKEDVWERLCGVPGCAEKHVGKGMCMTHWRRNQRGNALDEEDIRPWDRYTGCKVPGCDGKIGGRGYCRKHYMRLRYGWTEAEVLADKREGKPLFCQHDGCDRPNEMKGYCGAHYQRWIGRSKLPMDAPIRHKWLWRKKFGPKPEKCSVEVCDRKVEVYDMCHAHYLRFIGHSKMPLDEPIRKVRRKK